MQTVVAISLLCLLAAGLAAAALVRHVRITLTRTEEPRQRQAEFAQHLFSAASAGALRPMRSVPQQTVREIMANKSWNRPPEFVTVRPDSGALLPEDLAPSNLDPRARKSPQSAQWHGGERLDWAYFNKDLGDLTDPFPAARLRANSRKPRQ